MATDQDVEAAAEELMEDISEVADDTVRWTQAESADIYAALAGDCAERANLIRREIEDG